MRLSYFISFLAGLAACLTWIGSGCAHGHNRTDSLHLTGDSPGGLCSPAGHTTHSVLAQAVAYHAAGRYQQAADLLRNLPGITDTTIYSRHQKQALLLLAQSYDALGNGELAYRSFERYRIVKDTLLGREKNNLIKLLEHRYQTEEKDKKIAEQQLLLRENDAKAFRTRLIIWAEIVGGILTLLLFFISLGSFRKKQKITRKISEQLQHAREIEQIQAHLQGAEAERRKIANQLQQGVYPVIRRATDILKQLKKEDGTLHTSESFSESCQILTQVKSSLDDICLREAPVPANPRFLAGELRSFLDRVPLRNTLHVAFTQTGEERPLPAPYVLNLKRVVQELLQNIIKHSGATAASLHLEFTSGSLRLTVSDNGKGFKLLTTAQGMGLANIRKRLETMQGSLLIEQVRGTLVRITVPIAPDPRSESITAS